VRNAESAIEFYKKAFGAEEPTIIKKTGRSVQTNSSI
jgi:uncharacterized glyoxalase superfamily protein PhnB